MCLSSAEKIGRQQSSNRKGRESKKLFVAQEKERAFD
jgi:hypothetical protein